MIQIDLSPENYISQRALRLSACAERAAAGPAWVWSRDLKMALDVQARDWQFDRFDEGSQTVPNAGMSSVVYCVSVQSVKCLDKREAGRTQQARQHLEERSSQ
eukprot:g35198.t1